MSASALESFKQLFVTFKPKGEDEQERQKSVRARDMPT